MLLFKKSIKPKRIYLDYAAATPVRPEIVRLMQPYAADVFGNASAIHEEGRNARTAVDTARQTVATLLRVRPEEILFTSGGTESNNLAIMGMVESLVESGRAWSECEILTTKIEHPSVLGVVSALARRGASVQYIPVDDEGLIDHDVFAQLLSPQTVLVTFAYANSEIGVVQDVKRVTRTVRKYRAEHKQAFPYVHLDASQAPLYLPCQVDSLGVDLMTLDVGKCYGPKGVGVLMKKHTVPMQTLFAGGDQEFGLRPGTENTALIVGCAEALRYACEKEKERSAHIKELRDYGFQMLQSHIEGIVINGSIQERIANNINISIPGIDGEYAVVTLDMKGIAVSTKSACSGASGSGSKVVYALGGDDARALSTIRITLGEGTTKNDIETCVSELRAHVERTRMLRIP